jgi:hypothetical protein
MTGMSGRREVEEPRYRKDGFVAGSDSDEDEKLRAWQSDMLQELGYRATTAEGLVAIAWLNGDQIDLAHRIADLLNSGATHGQAARITLGADPIVIALLAEQPKARDPSALPSEHRVAS